MLTANFFIENDIEHAQMITFYDMRSRIKDYTLVGGLAVSLLSGILGGGRVVERSTVDVDYAVDASFATTGENARFLFSQGYRPVNGNRYEKNLSTVDMLVPGETLHLRSRILGGRAYDSNSAVSAAVLFPKIPLRLTVCCRTGEITTIDLYLANVESLVFMKISSLLGRSVESDIMDLYNLMQIVDMYTRNEVFKKKIGGWKLNEQGARGRRRDAQRAAGRLIESKGALSGARNFGVLPGDLADNIRKHIYTG